MSAQAKNPAARSIRRHLLVGIAAVAVLIGGFGAWAGTTPIAGAVVGIGTIVVEGNIKRVQHLGGGIIGAINVADGDSVAAGALLIQLDDTVTRASLTIVEAQIDQLVSRRMRLVAERDGAESLTIPSGLAARLELTEVAQLVSAEEALFSARAETLASQKQQLRERILQIGQETEGLVARLDAKRDELALIDQELVGIEDLFEKGLIPFSQVAALRRMKAQLAGEQGQLISEIARAAGRVTETELQILQLDQDRSTEVLSELSELDGTLAELTEQRVAALDELTRVDIRAPQDGFVHELMVHTIGGVVAPGETIMSIVPENNVLLIDARIRPEDIDQVQAGQPALLRLSAFNQGITPELQGHVQTVAADISQDTATGQTWYTVRIALPDDAMESLSGLILLPGMPVEAFIETEMRTVMSYLLKPFTDQLERAFREG
jgi:HlyD family secretion protein